MKRENVLGTILSLLTIPAFAKMICTAIIKEKLASASKTINSKFMLSFPRSWDDGTNFSSGG